MDHNLVGKKKKKAAQEKAPEVEGLAWGWRRGREVEMAMAMAMAMETKLGVRERKKAWSCFYRKLSGDDGAGRVKRR